jgi:hypothetical protein
MARCRLDCKILVANGPVGYILPWFRMPKWKSVLKFLEPGQIIRQHLEIGVCTSKEEVEGLEKTIPSVDADPYSPVPERQKANSG